MLMSLYLRPDVPAKLSLSVLETRVTCRVKGNYVEVLAACSSSVAPVWCVRLGKIQFRRSQRHGSEHADGHMSEAFRSEPQFQPNHAPRNSANILYKDG